MTIVVVTPEYPTPVVVTPAGPRGPAGTIVIGDVVTLPAGEPATVENVGTATEAEFDFGIPAGPAPVLTFDTTITGAPGSPADVDVTEIDPGQYELTFTVPEGQPGLNGVNAYLYIGYASDDAGTDFTTTFDINLDWIAFKRTTSPIVTPVAGDFAGLWKNTRGPVGPAATFSAGTVTTGSPGSSAIVDVDEVSPGVYEIDFTIPRGDPGSGDVASGDPVTVLNMATARILGRTTASTGPVEELTASQARGIADVYSVAQSDAADTAWYAAAVARANHSGTQPASSISDFAAAADARVALGANVKNVVSVAKTDTFTTTSTSWTDLTGLSVSITPSSASSRILIFAQIVGSTSALTTIVLFSKIVRGSTTVVVGDSDGANRTETHSALSAVVPTTSVLIAIDSPATTSPTTYKIQCLVNSGTGYVNRDNTDNDNAARARAVSTITVMEIGA